MSQQPQAQLTPKQQAMLDLEHARTALAFHASHAAEEWSPKAIITRSIEKHRGLWIGAAVIAGLATLKLVWPFGGSARQVTHSGAAPAARSGGWLMLLLSPLLALARKSAMSYGTQLVQSYLRQKVSPNDPDAGAV